MQKFLVSMSYLEVYNETVHDLLAPAPLRKGEPVPSLQLKLNADGYYDVPVSACKVFDCQLAWMDSFIDEGFHTYFTQPVPYTHSGWRTSSI